VGVVNICLVDRYWRTTIYWQWLLYSILEVVCYAKKYRDSSEHNVQICKYSTWR